MIIRLTCIFRLMCIIMKEIHRFIKTKLSMALMMICIDMLILEPLFTSLVETQGMKKGIMILPQKLLKIGVSGCPMIMGMED